MKVKLTQAFVDTAVCPEGLKQIEWVDLDTPGLYLLTRAAGKVSTFFCRPTIDGKMVHFKLGRSTDITLAAAIKRTQEIQARKILGVQPHGEKKPKQEELSLKQLFHEHYWKYIQDRKKSALRDWQLFERVEPALGDIKLSAITRRDLEIFHSSLLREGLAKATCNLHLRLLRHMLYLAVDWSMLEKNPAAKIKLFAEQNQVNNYMDQPTLQRFMSAVMAHCCRRHESVEIWRR